MKWPISPRSTNKMLFHWKFYSLTLCQCKYDYKGNLLEYQPFSNRQRLPLSVGLSESATLYGLIKATCNDGRNEPAYDEQHDLQFNSTVVILYGKTDIKM